MRANPVRNPSSFPTFLRKNQTCSSNLPSTTFRQPVAVVGASGCSFTSESLHPCHANHVATPASGLHIYRTCCPYCVSLPKNLKISATEEHGFMCSLTARSHHPIPPPLLMSFMVQTKKHLPSFLNINRKFE